MGDVGGLEPPAPCLQSRWWKILKCFAGRLHGKSTKFSLSSCSESTSHSRRRLQCSELGGAKKQFASHSILPRRQIHRNPLNIMMSRELYLARLSAIFF